MRKKRRKKYPTFNFKLVQSQLEGLILNTERALERRAMRATDWKQAQGFAQLRVTTLLAANYYDSIRWLCADEPEDYRRKLRYVLTAPVINRALLDILFGVMYQLESFPDSCYAYSMAGWRELNEEYARYHKGYSKDRNWRAFFKNFRQGLKMGVRELRIPASLQKDIKAIPYWKTPYQLIKVKAFSPVLQTFAVWMDDWFYKETSAIAHHSGLGIMKLAPYLMEDWVKMFNPESAERIPENLERFRAHEVSMTVIILLSMLSELESTFRLGNVSQCTYIWAQLRTQIFDAKDVWAVRYDSLLAYA